MKPYGRDKKYIGNPSSKIDYHVRPKRKVINWWEAQSNMFILPRTTIKANVKREIDGELNA